MNVFLKHFLEGSMYSVLDYASDKFINADFAKKYDADMLFELVLVHLALSLANGIEKQDINDECLQKVIQLLRTFNVNTTKIEISQCFISVEDFITQCEGFVQYEYDCRYRLMESVLFILFYNGKNIKEYQDIIKIAAFLELKKNDFIYLINKYKGAKA